MDLQPKVNSFHFLRFWGYNCNTNLRIFLIYFSFHPYIFHGAGISSDFVLITPVIQNLQVRRIEF